LKKKLLLHSKKNHTVFKKRLKNIRTWTDKLNIIINIINIIKFINVIKFTVNIITIGKNIDFDFKGKINYPKLIIIIIIIIIDFTLKIKFIVFFIVIIVIVNLIIIIIIIIFNLSAQVLIYIYLNA
jgi:hypothetical protein